MLQWLQRQEDKDIHLSAVTLGEIQAGIEITRARDPSRAEAIQTWADAVADSWNVLPIDARIYRRWAKLMHGQPDHLYEDALIAATALTHDLIVVTRNVADFIDFGVQLLNPFEL